MATRKRQPCLSPSFDLHLNGSPLEGVESYRYLGIVITPKLSWSTHIDLVCTKARKLISMLHRRFNTWADTNTLLCIYLTCIRPHLEYACQLWDPHPSSSIQQIEAVQKFACKVCLKRWDMDYDSMMEHLNISPLSVHRQYLKLTTMHNIISGHFYFPSHIFIPNNYSYSCV